MKLALALILCATIADCVHHPTVETFDDMLERTEGVNCTILTTHMEGDAPDCHRIYEAWVRGRSRVARVNPEAARIRMDAVSFFRPTLYWVPEKPYPLIADYILPGETEPHDYYRGFMYPYGGLQITYSYEEVIEHEAVHAILFLLFGHQRRTDEMIEAESGGYVPAADELYMIGCHSTSDDLWGDGPPGNETACQLPYPGN